MKKLIFILFLLISLKVFGQSYHVNRILIRDSLKLQSTWVDTIYNLNRDSISDIISDSGLVQLTDSNTVFATQYGLDTTYSALLGGSGLTDIVDDVTPQLGGDLGTNGNDINIQFNDPSDAINFGSSNGLIQYNSLDGLLIDGVSDNLTLQANNDIYFKIEPTRDLFFSDQNDTIYLNIDANNDLIHVRKYLQADTGIIFNSNDSLQNVEIVDGRAELTINSIVYSLNPNATYDTTVTLSSAQINTLGSTPVEVLPAAGPGLLYDIININLYYDYNTTTFTNDVSPTNGLEIDCGFNKFREPGTLLLNTEDRYYHMTSVSTSSTGTYTNTAIDITYDGDYGTGDGSLKIFINYKIITL